jgi:hypothetical protein
MGLIKKLFGSIFGLLSGILKILGIGKSGYYVEIDDSQTVEPNSTNQPAPMKTEATQKAQEKAVAKPTAVKPANPVNRLEPEPVAAKTPAAPKPDKSEPTGTFAPRFLVPNARGGRRRPGPSLSSFMDLARDVNPSLRG